MLHICPIHSGAYEKYLTCGLSVDIRDYLKKIVTYGLLQSALSLVQLLPLFESEFHQQLVQYGLGAVIHLSSMMSPGSLLNNYGNTQLH